MLFLAVATVRFIGGLREQSLTHRHSRRDQSFEGGTRAAFGLFALEQTRVMEVGQDHSHHVEDELATIQVGS